MNCSEARELAPRYLTGELEPARAGAYAAHLKSCSACSAEIEQLRNLDILLRAAVLSENVACEPLENRVRQQIAAETRDRKRWLWIASSAAIVLLAAGIVARIAFRVPTLYAEAATDHHREIVDRQPRVWVTDAAGIAGLAESRGIPASAIQTLNRTGFRLERAKICRLDSTLYLHLVYTDGAREVSTYLRSRQTPGIGPMTTADVGAEHLAVVNGAHFTALFVADRAKDAVARARAAAADL
jgi:hypothetical protein